MLPQHRVRLCALALLLLLLAAAGLRASEWYRASFAKTLWDLQDLDPADPLSAEAIAIGRELGQHFGKIPPGKHWWYGSRVAGVLLIVRGNGRIDAVRFHPDNHAAKRFSFPATHAVLDALAAGSRAGTVRTGTILHFGFEDHDVFFHQAEEGEASPVARSVLKLTREHPNLFWLHWNPSVINKTLGTIGPRMVPIPDFEALHGLDISHLKKKRFFGWPSWMKPQCESPLRKQVRLTAPRSALATSAKPWRQRDAKVAWRGSTTGPPMDYRQSDRYRVVDAFLQYERSASVPSDVKFGDTCQGVTEADLPAGAMGGRLSATEMMNARVLFDIDGNANAWSGFRWKLLAGAAVVKVDARRYIQWYYPLLRHGRDVWVVPVPQAGEGAAAQAVRDSVNLALGDAGPLEAAGEVLARNAEAFARAHLTPPRALAALYDILGDLEPYRDGTRSWTVQLHHAE